MVNYGTIRLVSGFETLLFAKPDAAGPKKYCIHCYKNLTA